MDALLDQARVVAERHWEEKRALAAARERRAAAEQARTLAQAVAKEVQERAHAKVTDVVSRSLAAVFPDNPYRFKIAFEAKRGRTEARLVFERGGLEVNPLDAAGGGAVDVAAFALRLSALLLTRPPCRRLLVLDEPFRHLSAGHRPAVKALLVALAAELGVQIIMVSHADELRCGQVIEL